MWGVILTLGWIVAGGNFWFGVLPILFMAVGDAVTGVARNALYRRRTKSWWGNLAMAAFSIPAGAILGIAGVLAGAIVSVVEHFEFGPIDDNITVPSISFLILVIANFYAPWLLTFQLPRTTQLIAVEYVPFGWRFIYNYFHNHIIAILDVS
jgi:dolichol kinase